MQIWIEGRFLLLSQGVDLPPSVPGSGVCSFLLRSVLRRVNIDLGCKIASVFKITNASGLEAFVCR